MYTTETDETDFKVRYHFPAVKKLQHIVYIYSIGKCLSVCPQ